MEFCLQMLSVPGARRFPHRLPFGQTGRLGVASAAGTCVLACFLQLYYLSKYVTFCEKVCLEKGMPQHSS